MSATGIYGNTVTLENVTQSDVQYGISVQGGTNNKISLNTVGTAGTSAVTFGKEKTIYGISIETSESNLVSDNIIYKLGTGLRFYNTHANNTVACNSLSESYRQITMEGSFIGSQGDATHASDNTWVRGTNTESNLAATDNSLSCFWYIQSSFGPYYPGIGGDEMFPLGFYTLPPASTSLNCLPNCQSLGCLQDQLTRIVKREIEFADMSIETEYIVDRFAFDAISNDTSLMHLNTENDSILEAFYQTVSNGNIYNFSQIRDQLRLNHLPIVESENIDLVPENNSEANEQAFNAIYINT